MKRLNVNRSLTMLTAALLFITAGINAQPGRGFGRGQGQGMGPGMGRGMGPGDGSLICNRLDAWLDLTDEQEEKILDLRVDIQKKILPRRNEIGEKRARLHTLMTSDPSDESEINQLIDEIGHLRTEIHKAMVDHHLGIRKVLTKDQKVLFDSRFPGGKGSGFRGGRMGWGNRPPRWN